MTEQDCPCCMDMEMDVGETYDPAFITRHNSTTGRDANDCHPISAITGLQDALDAKMDDSQIDTESLTDSDAKIPSSALMRDVLDGKVDTVPGKGLSANDFTDADVAKLDGIEAGAEVNVIETVKVNGSALTPSDKAVDVPVPTKTSDISNDSGFITKAVDDLANYYLKSQTYTKAEVEALVSVRLKFAIVQTLPATGEADTIYLVPAASPQTGNVRDEYIYLNGAWELIGSTEFVLTISQDATGIEINGTALQEASASQPGLMTAAQVTALAGKADAGASYTKAEADTLLAGKVSGSGNIGTDLKPIIIVNGVAVAVANPLVDTATAQDILAKKTFRASTEEQVVLMLPTSIGTAPDSNTIKSIRWVDTNGTRLGQIHLAHIKTTNVKQAVLHAFYSAQQFATLSLVADGASAYATVNSRAYDPTHTSDIVTQGSLASNPEILHPIGTEAIPGIKLFTVTPACLHASVSNSSGAKRILRTKSNTTETVTQVLFGRVFARNNNTLVNWIATFRRGGMGYRPNIEVDKACGLTIAMTATGYIEIWTTNSRFNAVIDAYFADNTATFKDAVADFDNTIVPAEALPTEDGTNYIFVSPETITGA